MVRSHHALAAELRGAGHNGHRLHREILLFQLLRFLPIGSSARLAIHSRYCSR
jgi:hypothetical protein